MKLEERISTNSILSYAVMQVMSVNMHRLDPWYNQCGQQTSSSMPAALPSAHLLGAQRNYIALSWVQNFIRVQGPSDGNGMPLPQPHLLCMYASDGFCLQEFHNSGMKPCSYKRHHHEFGSCDICDSPVPLSIRKGKKRKGMCMVCVNSHRHVRELQHCILSNAMTSRDQLDEASKRVSQLSEALTKKDAESKQQKQRLDEALAQVSQLSEALTKKDAESKQQKQRLDEALAQVSQLSEELTKKDAELKQQKQRLDEASNQQVILRQNNMVLQKKHTKSKQDLNGALAQVLEVSNALTKKDVELKDALKREVIYRKNNTVLQGVYEKNKKVCTGGMLELTSYASKTSLGQGGMGMVGAGEIKVTTATGRSCLLPVAVKVPLKTGDHVYLDVEYKLLTGLLADVKCVVDVLGQFEIKGKNQFAMVMPRCKGTLLEFFSPTVTHVVKQGTQKRKTNKIDLIKHWKFDPFLPPSSKRATACQCINWVSKQLHRSLRDLHRATIKWGHNDISLRNVMIDGNSDRLEGHNLILIDFGLYGKGWKHGIKFNTPGGWFSDAFGSSFTSLHTDYFQAMMCIISLMIEHIGQRTKLNKLDMNKARLELGRSFEAAHVNGQDVNLGWTTYLIMEHTQQQCSDEFHRTVCVCLRKYWAPNNKKSITMLDKLFAPPYDFDKYCTSYSTEASSHYEALYDELCFQ